MADSRNEAFTLQARGRVVLLDSETWSAYTNGSGVARPAGSRHTLHLLYESLRLDKGLPVRKLTVGEFQITDPAALRVAEAARFGDEVVIEAVVQRAPWGTQRTVVTLAAVASDKAPAAAAAAR